MDNLALAGCALFDPDGKVLLIHRNTPGRVQWEVPGGKIEEGEEAEDTARREIEEEIGVQVAITQQLGAKEFQEDGHSMHYIWFQADILSGTPACLEDKYDDLRYFSWEELRDMSEEISPNTQNLVAAYFAGELSFS